MALVKIVLSKRFAYLVAPFVLIPLTVNAEKRTVPFIDGMTIQTEDVAATIEIRAKSFGPGRCGVRFYTGTHSVDILAPLTDWSEWRELTSHFGSVSFTISSVVMCDTGILGQVRYHPDTSE